MLTIGAGALETALGFELRCAQLLRAVECTGQGQRQFVGRAARQRLLGGELTEQCRGFLRHERFTFDGQPVGLRGEPPLLVLELLDARPLDLGSLMCRALLAIEVFPALLPAG